jgi:Ca-activated chloride channel family protein
MTFPRSRTLLWLVLAGLLAIPSGPGGATEPAPGARGPRLAGADELQSPFLLKSTDVKVTVTGPVAHAVVTQSWENPNTFPVDGLYIFPLPENAAVTDMSLRIGGRTIRGTMKRREEARAIYEQARSEGRVAGLLEQERENLFAQQVANIVPGERIEVILEFDSGIRCPDGGCEFVFPTVVGPRFIPCRQADPGKIDPPVVVPHQTTGQRLTMQVALDPGVPMRQLESPSHRVEISRDGEERARVRLSITDRGSLDRDFRLRWRVGGEAAEMGVLAWRSAGRKEPGVFTLILQPPADLENEEIQPRELVFVLDCSGSMRGVPLEAARNVVRRALAAVRPGDTFQIIRFSDRSSGLSPDPLPATPANLRAALGFLDTLQGEGGTEMISGIRAALGRSADPQRLRIVAFLTDGYIGNEREILGEVRRLLRGARLFSFGIGSSVNRYLLEGLAEEGRGEAAFLSPRETPDAMVKRFVERIAAPVLTDIRLTWEDLEVEDQEPRLIPDLFAGSPVVVHGRYSRPGTGLLILEGMAGGRRRILREVVTLPEEAADHAALGRLWARARIHQLERELHDGPSGEVVEAITRLGLRHHLMTAYTSLVAVDSEIANWTGSSTPVTIPVEMPEDVSYEGNFGYVASGKAMPILRQAPLPAAEPLRSLGYLLPQTAPPAGVRAGDESIRDPRSAIAPATPGSAASGSASGPRGDGGVRKEVPPGPKAKEESGAPAGTDRGRSDSEAKSSIEPDELKDSGARFTRVSVFLPDGTRLTVESDGEVWRTQGRGRTLVGSLSAPEMAEFRRLLAAARPDSWTGGGSGGRILLEGPAGVRAASLPSSDPAIEALAEWIRRHQV